MKWDLGVRFRVSELQPTLEAVSQNLPSTLGAVSLALLESEHEFQFTVELKSPCTQQLIALTTPRAQSFWLQNLEELVYCQYQLVKSQVAWRK